MSIAFELEVGLRVFGLGAETAADRLLIGQAFAPHAGTISRKLFRSLGDELPGLAPVLLVIEEEAIESIARCTRNLFLRPYDERWEAESMGRITFEQTHGFDIRTRAAVNRALLSALSEIIARRWRFSVKTAVRLLDVTGRVLMHDSAIAASYHHSGRMRVARKTGKDLLAALEGFESATQEARRAVSVGSEQLRGTAHDLRAVVEIVGDEARRAKAASDATSVSLNAAADATHAMAYAVAELQCQSATSAVQAADAAALMKIGNATIRSLSEAVRRIGSVSGVIANVATKTNMLALNATIEAARAGDAGRGFAVVAGEVKALAAQTSDATSHIAELIAGITTSAGAAVAELDSAGKRIEGVSATSEQLAETVRRQMQSSEEIENTAVSALQNATEMSAAVTGVASSVERSDRTVAEILSLAEDFARRIRTLDEASTTLFEATRRNNDAVGPLKSIFKVA